MLYLKRPNIRPGDLVLEQCEAVKDGGFWKVDVVVARPHWFMGLLRPDLLHKRRQFIDCNKRKAISRASSYRRELGYTHKAAVEPRPTAASQKVTLSDGQRPHNTLSPPSGRA